MVTAPSLRLEGPARRPTGRRTGWAGQRGKALVRAHYLVLVATLLIWGRGGSSRALTSTRSSIGSRLLFAYRDLP